MGDLITVRWICTSEQSSVVCSFCLLTIDGFATLDVEDVVCNSLSIKTFFSRGWGWSGMGSGIGYVRLILNSRDLPPRVLGLKVSITTPGPTLYMPGK